MHDYLQPDAICQGDARDLLPRIRPQSVALSVWSPPYFVGKSYEKHLSYDDWRSLLCEVIGKHYPILKPGCFLAINIADILCFPDQSIPRIQAENMNGHRLPVTRDDVLRVLAKHPDYNRYQIASVLGVSEQTVDRRMKNNNIRGGKYMSQTRVNLVGGFIEDVAYRAGLYLYDRRIWAKDPCWEHSKWHTNSYRAVDEFEYIYMFWKPGITTIDRQKLSRKEWAEWGSRAVWNIASVRANNDHEAKFPLELPRRLIRLLTAPGETVLDCFVGSGTSAVAAFLEGRRFICIDKERKYVKLARQAVRKAEEVVRSR
jgi:site-specific DNA-methyltransferase (adenine-specific)